MTVTPWGFRDFWLGRASTPPYRTAVCRRERPHILNQNKNVLPAVSRVGVQQRQIRVARFLTNSLERR